MSLRLMDERPRVDERRKGTREGAISKADFSVKMSIAYKECLETKYWLSLLKDTEYIDVKAFESIYRDADEIGKMLFAIIKTTRIDI